MAHLQFQRDRHVAIQARGNPNFAAPPASAAPTLPCSAVMAGLAPDIARRITAAWSDVSLTSLLIEQLLIGEDAQGLPYAVTSELLRLYEFNARCRVNDAPDTAWELPVSRPHRLSPNTSFQGSQS